MTYNASKVPLLGGLYQILKPGSFDSPVRVLLSDEHYTICDVKQNMGGGRWMYGTRKANIVYPLYPMAFMQGMTQLVGQESLQESEFCRHMPFLPVTLFLKGVWIHDSFRGRCLDYDGVMASEAAASVKRLCRVKFLGPAMRQGVRKLDDLVLQSPEDFNLSTVVEYTERTLASKQLLPFDRLIRSGTTYDGLPVYRFFSPGLFGD